MTTSASVVLDLVRRVSAGLRVLRERDGLQLSDATINERARNIVQAIVGDYTVELPYEKLAAATFGVEEALSDPEREKHVTRRKS